MAVFVGMSTCIKAAGTVLSGPDRLLPIFLRLFPMLPFWLSRENSHLAFTTSALSIHMRARRRRRLRHGGSAFFALTAAAAAEAITLNSRRPLLVVGVQFDLPRRSHSGLSLEARSRSAWSAC
ncbi:hypothetical protein ACFSQT_32995 [Mesorhizobium calcicola]|uniref:Uncharacterized protein n=1 Tax=Mesorhizobium calcicola TaxID=1300310 RepID=A0ABW4WMT9_9HYPH